MSPSIVRTPLWISLSSSRKWSSIKTLFTKGNWLSPIDKMIVTFALPLALTLWPTLRPVRQNGAFHNVPQFLQHLDSHLPWVLLRQSWQLIWFFSCACRSSKMHIWMRFEEECRIICLALAWPAMILMLVYYSAHNTMTKIGWVHCNSRWGILVFASSCHLEL